MLFRSSSDRSFEDSDSLDQMDAGHVDDCKLTTTESAHTRFIALSESHKKCAWFVMHCVCLAMQNGSVVKLAGNSIYTEIEETFIGGCSRCLHLASLFANASAKFANCTLDNIEKWSASTV